MKEAKIESHFKISQKYMSPNNALLGNSALTECMLKAELNALGFDLVEFRSFKNADIETIRITINDPKAHVGHEQCILASKALQKSFPKLCNYNVEVWSPGIGREIKSPKDFEIFKGKLIEITFIEGEKQIGFLKEKTEIALSIIQKNQKEKMFPLEIIKKVVLALDENKDKKTITEISVEDT
jgi:ribosome maturation factor RimP